jgi:hypothetical protein
MPPTGSSPADSSRQPAKTRAEKCGFLFALRLPGVPAM